MSRIRSLHVAKTSKIGPKYAFLVILGQILPFFAHFVQCPTKNQCEQGAWVGFPFDFSSKKKDFLPKNDQIQPEIGISLHCWLIWCPLDGLAGGCGARAVSRKTPVYFITVTMIIIIIVIIITTIIFIIIDIHSIHTMIHRGTVRCVHSAGYTLCLAAPLEKLLCCWFHSQQQDLQL